MLVGSAGVACDLFAGYLLGIDGLDEAVPDDPQVAVPSGASGRGPGRRRRALPEDAITTVDGLRVTTPLQTLLDVAPLVDDLVWEQALEWVLRHGHATVDDIEHAASGIRGADRVRRVLALRPPGAPPTGSLLETLMVQRIRAVPSLPTPQRQVVVRDEHDQFVARVDVAWRELGLFLELDGLGHKGQPVYDATRETGVAAATGWLCGRFTWHEVRRLPRWTERRLARLAEQARRRPVAP